MSFFPQIMEGPICRYGDTAQRLWEAPPVAWENFLFGAQRILWGMMKKMVVADRLNLFIRQVFWNYAEYDDGLVIALAAVAYTLQLYMDFSGTMDLALGSGQLFGVTLPENFRRPFFSRTIGEFWRRWHITLARGLRDYVFYPVSLARPMKRLTTWGRKHLGPHYGPLLAGSVALFCVWLGQRPVARGGVALYLLRDVPLLLDPAGEPHRAGDPPLGPAVPCEPGGPALPDLPDGPHGDPGVRGGALLPGRRPAGGAGHVFQNAHPVLPGQR